MVHIINIGWPIMRMHWGVKVYFPNCPRLHLVKTAYHKIFFLFLKQNICCVYSKEPYQLDGSFEHPKYMLKLMGKKYLQFYAKKFCLS